MVARGYGKKPKIHMKAIKKEKKKNPQKKVISEVSMPNLPVH